MNRPTLALVGGAAFIAAMLAIFAALALLTSVGPFAPVIFLAVLVVALLAAVWWWRKR